MKPDRDEQARSPVCSVRKAAGALALAVMLMTGAAGAQDEDIRFFRIGTGTTGGTYFPIGGIIANAISNPPGSPGCESGGSCGVPGLIAVAQASSGSGENVEHIVKGEIESGLPQADVVFCAYTGRSEAHTFDLHSLMRPSYA